MDLKLYLPTILWHQKGLLSGDQQRTFEHDDPDWKDGRIVQAFLADDDIQQMTVCSTNIGIVYSFTKQFRPKEPSR